jgi:hypothetical protein
MFDYSGNIHMHTPFSDGVKWHAEIAEDAIRAGLDFIIVTDHNLWVDGVEGYYENDQGRVLLLVGEEVHDTRRTPQANHFLAYGAERELSCFAADPQSLINANLDAGGIGFLAHPFDPALPAFGRGSLSWQSWDVTGYTGLEIWNFMSSFKGLLSSRPKALRAANQPDKYITGPSPAVLAKWDELLTLGHRVVAVGGSDAHGLTYSMWSITRVMFPYEFLFRTVNTHIVLKKELTGDFKEDKRHILRALERGNCWVGYDLPGPTDGFRFSGQSRTKGIMGEEIKLGAGATLQVSAPEQCHIRLIREGEVVANCPRDTNLTYLPNEPGAYRAECLIPYRGRDRGWIYSNPIYLV